VLEAGSGTKFLTNSANPTLWTLFGSHKELGGALMHFGVVNANTEGSLIISDYGNCKFEYGELEFGGE
jgi:hypothetical protein